jgi:hypothetical protein
MATQPPVPATPEGPRGLDLLAAELRADASDVATFFAVLADKLADSLPGRVAVERRRPGWRRPPEVTAVEVNLAEGGDGTILRAERAGQELRCSVARSVRGVLVSNRPVPPDAWVATLVEELGALAARSEQTRSALGGLLT